jgi:GT2 family glycosyltransferase
MERTISVIIPTVRRQDLLRECLESLGRQTFSDFETILVSDGAGGWAAQVAGDYGCALVTLPHRRGFAAAVNAGVAASRSEYVLLLNDDVRLEPDWLRLASSLLDGRPDIAFCCGKIYGPDGVVLDNAGDALSLGGSAWRLGHGRPDSPEFDLERTVLGCPGTASLVRRKLFEALGGLDEDFFAYLEDIDFSLRALRRGLRGLYLPQAKCTHREGATSGGPESPFVFRYLTQNQLMILAKDYPWRLWPRFAWAQLLWFGMAIRKNLFGAFLAGVWGFLRLLPRALRKRQPWRRNETAAFLARLRESEAAIAADLRSLDRVEHDTFWRLYFSLFPPRRKTKGAGNREEGVEHVKA